MQKLMLTSRRKISVAIFLFIAFLAIFSVFMAYIDESVSATSTADINVDVVNGIAIRILDKTATQEINNINLDLLPTTTGTFASDNFIVDVSTSNKTGYKLYLASSYVTSSTSTINNITVDGETYTSDLVHDEIGTYTIPTLSTDISKADFMVSGSSAMNRWGYSVDDATYKSVPLYGAETEIDYQSAPTAHSNTPVYVAVNANMDKGAGVYFNQLMFSAIAEPVPVSYQLSFDANGGTNAPAAVTGTSVAGQMALTIPDGKPTRDGFNFAGWSESSSATTASYQPGDTYTIVAQDWNTQEKTLYAVWDEIYTYTVAFNCNSGINCPSTMTAQTTDTTKSFTISSTKPDRTQGYVFTTYNGSDSNSYGAGDTVNLTSSNNTITLTAQWQIAPFWTITNMQEMTSDICNSVYTPSNATGAAVTLVTSASQYNVVSDGQPYVAQRSLYDIRDNNMYTVRKLADGNCWMTENLRLVFKNGYVGAYNNGAIQQTSVRITPQNSNVDTTRTFLDSTELTLGSNWGTLNSDSIPDEEVNVAHSYYTDNKVFDGDGIAQTKGSYYNWYTATAGYGQAQTDGDVPYSICPYGWRLPDGVWSDKSWGALLFNDNAYKIATTSWGIDQKAVETYRSLPFSIAVYGEYTDINGERARLWTRSVRKQTYGVYIARYFYYQMNDFYQNVNGGGAKTYGVPIRCVNI